MKSIEVYCPAKVNLFLNVTKYDEETKLHDIVSYNQTINMFDKITITDKLSRESNIKIVSKDNIPKDENNSAYKAAKVFFDYTLIPHKEFTITIEKGIPLGSGLGGESTDAAGVILALNRYYNANLTRGEMIKLAFMVGSDTPYFIVGNFARVTNYGKDVTSLENDKFNFFLIVEPDFSLSTEEMYKKLDNHGLVLQEYNPDVLHNDFVNVMPDELKKLREYLMQFKSLHHSLTGSGSCYFLANDILSFNHDNMVHNIREEFPKFKVYTHKKIEGHHFMTTTSF